MSGIFGLWHRDGEPVDSLGSPTCLARGLTWQVLAAQGGGYARLRLGVARTNAGRLEAHAWLESGGRVLVGGTSLVLERYTPLLTLDPGVS